MSRVVNKALWVSFDDISFRFDINDENKKFLVFNQNGTDRDLVYIGLVPNQVQYQVKTEIPVSIPFQNKTKRIQRLDCKLPFLFNIKSVTYYLNEWFLN